MDRSKSTDRGPYIGRSMPRFEDLRLVRGAGRYSDDISVPGQAYAVFVRSPHAHALIKRIDTAKARAMKGVLAVLTGADYVADGLKGALQRPNPAGAIDIKIPAFAPEKRPVLDERQHPLALDRVRYPGEARGDGDRGEHPRRERRRRSGRGRVRGAAGGDRRPQGASAPSRSGRQPPPTTSRSTRSSATPPRCRRRSPRPTSWSSRRSAISASSTPDGAALGRRVLRCGDGFLHADLRQPGRPRAAQRAGGKLRRAATRKSASSAPTSAAASGCATISIPSRPRSCGRRSASAGR